MEDDEEIKDEETPKPEDHPETDSGLSDSILTSVKKSLGLMEENEEFDSDIIMNINSAIMTLRQLGVGDPMFRVRSKKETYEDFLNGFEPLFQNIPFYIYLKVRLGFDPPSIQSLLQSIKDQILEQEWRIRVQMEEIQIAESLIMPI